MRRLLFAALAALLGVAPFVHAQQAQPAEGPVTARAAIAVRLIPLPERIAMADCIVVGKVASIEDKTIEAKPFPNSPNKVEYKIAVIKIEDGLIGAKGLTHIRVAFREPMKVPQPPPPPGQVQPKIRPIRPFPQPLVLAKDMEGCWLLKKHADETFYDSPMADSFFKKDGGAGYEKQVAGIKQTGKLIAEPMTSLKSKSAEDRLNTAAYLVYRYTIHPGIAAKQEPIDAAESKLILEALADADWTQRDVMTQVSPQMVVGRLGLQPKDGWMPPPFKDYQKEYPEFAKKWLKDNAGKYRVQRWVAEKAK